MNLKVRVTPEESKRAQEILFKMGYGMNNRVRYTDEEYLYVFNTKRFGLNNSVDLFNSHPFKEVAPSYFEIIDTKLWKTLNQ